MDERVRRLTTLAECENFERNAANRGFHDLAQQARRRAVEIRAESHGANSEVEREALQGLYAYEDMLTKRNGRRTAAGRTRQMFGRLGIIAAIEKVVSRDADSDGYRALKEMGLPDLAFEAIVMRYPEHFSRSAVERARERMTEWQ